MLLMSIQDKSHSINTLKLLFFIQLGLLLLLAVIFTVGYIHNEIEVGAFFFAIILGTLGASISMVRRIQNGKFDFSFFHKNNGLIFQLMPVL